MIIITIITIITTVATATTVTHHPQSSLSSSSSRSGYRRAPKKLDLPPNKARRVVHGEKDLSLVAGLAEDFSGLGLTNSRKTDKKKKESAPIALV